MNADREEWVFISVTLIAVIIMNSILKRRSYLQRVTEAFQVSLNTCLF